MALVLAAALVGGLSSGRTIAEFSSTTANSGNTFSAAATFGAVSASGVVVKSSASAASYPSTVLADAPVAYWRFGEPVGSTSAVDAGGNGNHAAIPTTNPPELNRPGLVGDGNTAFRWGSNDAAVSVPHAAALQLNGSFSIELLVNSETIYTASTERWLLDKGGNPDVNGWRISYDDSRTLRLRRNGVAVASATGGLGTLASPRHLVVTYDGANVRWYVDGLLNTTTAATFPAGSGTAPLTFAGNWTFNDQVKIDEPALYATALSADRVNAHFRATKVLTADVCAGYRVYANVTDNGSPATGVTSVTANLSSMTAGAAAVAMTPGSYTIGGVSYGYRSPSIRTGVVTGNYGYSLTWVDASGSRTQSNLTASVVSPIPITTQWVTGFESGVATTPDLFSSTSQDGLSTTNVKSGAYARVMSKAAGTSSFVAKDGFTTTTALSFAVRLGALPGADVTSLAMVNTSTTPLYLGWQASTSKFTLRWGANAPAVALVPSAAGTWYTIDLKVDVGANPNAAAWRIDEVDQSATNLVGAAQAVTDVRFGSSVAADVFQAQYDDIVHSRTATDYPIGPVRVLASRPNGMAPHFFPENFTQDDGTAITSTSWDRLDEPVLNSAADGVRQNTTSGYLGVTMQDTTEVCVRGAQAVVAQHKASSQANSAKAAAMIGPIEFVVWSGDSTFVTTTGHRTAVITPTASTGTWAPGLLNGVDFRLGNATDANPAPYWDALLLEYVTSG